MSQTRLILRPHLGGILNAVCGENVWIIKFSLCLVFAVCVNKWTLLTNQAEPSKIFEQLVTLCLRIMKIQFICLFFECCGEIILWVEMLKYYFWKTIVNPTSNTAINLGRFDHSKSFSPANKRANLRFCLTQMNIGFMVVPNQINLTSVATCIPNKKYSADVMAMSRFCDRVVFSGKPVKKQGTAIKIIIPWKNWTDEI